MIGAPECYRFDHIIDHLPLNVKQTVDIWSLGCIFSEIAVWVVLGRARLIKYRDMRKEETSRIHGHRDRGCFHDSDGAVLTSVKSMHDEVFENVRNSDHITKSVIKKLCDEMLDIVEGRPDAQQCWRKAQRILEDAETKLRKPRSVSLMPGYPPGGLSPRLPPRLPPKEDEPTPWTSEPKGKGRSSTVDIQRRRTLNPDENSKYGSDLVMQPSLVITPPTSPLVRARSDLEQGTSDEAEKLASQISGLGIRETSTSAEGVAQSDDLISRGDPTPGQYLKQTAKTETTPPLPQIPSRPKLAEWKLADAYMWMTEKKQGRESFNSMPNRNELNGLGLRDQVSLCPRVAG
jgi:serine/threonine protein kinase